MFFLFETQTIYGIVWSHDFPALIMGKKQQISKWVSSYTQCMRSVTDSRPLNIKGYVHFHINIHRQIYIGIKMLPNNQSKMHLPNNFCNSVLCTIFVPITKCPMSQYTSWFPPLSPWFSFWTQYKADWFNILKPIHTWRHIWNLRFLDLGQTIIGFQGWIVSNITDFCAV